MDQSLDRRDAKVVDALQRQLANAVALAVGLKGYHWYLSEPRFTELGPFYYELDRRLDEHARDLVATLDRLGRRIRALGAEPVSTLPDLAAAATVALPPPGATGPRTLLERVMTGDRQVIGETRAALEMARRGGDSETADLLADLVRVHEKQEWDTREMGWRAPDELSPSPSAPPGH